MNKFKLLITVATKAEITPFIQKINKNIKINKNNLSFSYKNISIDIFITGIGPVFTTFMLSEILYDNTYDLAVNTGVCGSFNEEIPLASTVNIVSDEFGDLGISSKNNFATLFETNFINENSFPFNGAKLLADKYYSKFIEVNKVSGITVSNASGESQQIELRKNKFHADVESMEGAAFFYVCLSKGIKCIQVRTVSNYIEERNIENWKIKEAILNLSEELYKIVNLLSD